MTQHYRPRHKDLAKLAKRYRKELGWTVEETKSGHIRWTAPDGRYQITPSTPGADGLKHSIRHLGLMAEGRPSPAIVQPRQEMSD